MVSQDFENSSICLMSVLESTYRFKSNKILQQFSSSTLNLIRKSMVSLFLKLAYFETSFHLFIWRMSGLESCGIITDQLMN